MKSSLQRDPEGPSQPHVRPSKGDGHLCGRACDKPSCIYRFLCLIGIEDSGDPAWRLC
jgi:hypothetical protein